MTKEEFEIIASTPITMDCFEMGNFEDVLVSTEVGDYLLGCAWQSLIQELESLRNKYNETKDKRYFYELIRLLPNSYKVVKL